MNCKAINIIFLGCLLFGGIANAQSLKIDAIEIMGLGQQSDDDFGSYDSFVSKVKNPALFQTGLVNQPDNIGIIRTSGFIIDFIFVQVDEPVNEFVIGIQSGSIETEVFKQLSFQNDSVQFNSDITNNSQYFTLRSGYQRVFLADKRVRVVAGIMLHLGIPVSSKTTQTIESNLIGGEYDFFAQQSAYVGFSIPFGVRFKLFRNVNMSIMSRPTFLFQKVDGTSSTSLLRGTNISLQFKLRSK